MMRNKPAGIASRKRKQPNASTSESPSPSPPWTELPVDITANILQRLDVAEILDSAKEVCTTWWRVCKDPSMWRKIDMSKENSSFIAGIMFGYAVDLSRGQLVDARLGRFGSNPYLAHIAEGSATKRFPLLEELHLFRAEFPSESLELVGRSCPLLKSFSIGTPASRCFGRDSEESWCNKDAFAIAKTMPGLRHLCLLGNGLTNEGLVAILDGCAGLESLDLRECFGVKLAGDLGKRCSQQVKSVKRLYDSIEDLEYNFYDRSSDDDTDSDTSYETSSSDD